MRVSLRRLGSNGRRQVRTTSLDELTDYLDLVLPRMRCHVPIKGITDVMGDRALFKRLRKIVKADPKPAVESVAGTNKPRHDIAFAAPQSTLEQLFRFAAGLRGE